MIRTAGKNRERRSRARGLAGAALAAGLFAYGAAVWAQANVYQMYYVPVPEDAATAFNANLTSPGNIGRTVLSISVALPNTIIYWDHDEDGYEADITNPVQATSEIWGDGDCSNGHHPDYGCGPGEPGDVFSAGDVLVIAQTYNVTNNAPPTDGTAFSKGSDLRLNGGDRFGSTKALAVTRIFYNNPGTSSPGTLMTGSVEIEAFSYWGTGHHLPVGTDTTGHGTSFQHATAFIQAAEPDTEVTVSIAGGSSTNHTLSAGETLTVSGITEGSTVTADKKVQVNLLTGSVPSAYQSRWYRIPPVENWASEYYSPVGKTYNSTGRDVRYYLYNPGGTQIDVDVTYRHGGSPGDLITTAVQVPAEGTVFYDAPQGYPNTGLHFKNDSDLPFYVMAVVDAPSAGAYDWGFSLVPASGLTGQTIVGWAPAYDNPQPGVNSPASSVEAGPVWVTAVDDTTICVDFDRDGEIDFAQQIRGLETLRILDGSDNDMTGALIYSINDNGAPNSAPITPHGDTRDQCYSTDDETVDVNDRDTQTDIAVVWGQNPAVAATGAPAIDAGTTVLAVPKYGVSKRVLPLSEGIDADTSGTVTPGDTIVYVIEVDNYGALPLNGGVLADVLPDGLTYVPGLSHASPPWDCDTVPGTCTLNIPAIAPFSVANFRLAATIGSGSSGQGETGTVVENSVTFDPPGDDPSLGGDATSPVHYVDVTTQLNAPPVYEPGGGNVTVTVNFGNAGTRDADVSDGEGGLTYRVVIEGVGGWTPGSVTCVEAQCAYDPDTGTVTFSGLPPSLSPSQYTGAITLVFPPAPSGAITVTSSVTTEDLQPVDHLPDSATRIIQPLGSPQVDVTTTVAPPAVAQLNQPVTVPVSFTNYGSDPASVTSYALQLPTEGVSAVSCDSGVTCAYDAATGSVTITGLDSTLPPGGSTGFNLQYTPTQTGSFEVQSLITPSNETENMLPNTASGVTVVTAGSADPLADVTVSINPPATAGAGSPVTVPVTFSNIGPVDAEDVTYEVVVTGELQGVGCAPACTSSYDAVSDTTTITWTGLPGTLTPGQTVGTSFTYTAPVPSAPLVITQTAMIGTDTEESNTLNNTAQAPTTILPADMGASINLPPSPLPIGGTVEGSVVCANVGGATALNPTCEVEGLPDGTPLACELAGTAIELWPPTLEPGQEIVCSFSFPADGPRTITGTTGADNDSNPANDQASGPVRILTATPIPVGGPLGLLLLALSVIGLAARRGRLRG